MMLSRLIVFALLGGAAGTAHFVAIARDAALLSRGGSFLAAAGLRLGRLVLTFAVLALAARQGWQTLFAATAGFLAARQVVLRRLGRLA